MNRSSFAFAPVIVLFLTSPAFAERLSLRDISAYINGISTAKVPFTQVHDDGAQLAGTLYIQRPGRARFEYAPPEASLVIAGSGQVAIFDVKSDQPPEQYPLARTPLNLILGNNVDLQKSNMVVAHEGDDTGTIVTARDPKHPEYGTIQMVFTPAPIQLREWILTDENGNQTQVQLGEMEQGLSLSPSLFSITMEVDKRHP